MKKSRVNPNPLRSFLRTNKIATLEQMKTVLGTTGTMTVFRRLNALGGKYYTLLEIPKFNEQGLWSQHSVWFSQYGNLIATVREFVEEAAAGWTAQELESVLCVDVRRALLQLYQGKAIHREKYSGVYTYFSVNSDNQRSQLLMRKKQAADAAIGLPVEVEVLSHEIKAAIILFFSLLDEQQRRLYAGLEAHKMGHGGDLKISELLGLDVHTVARGRIELFGGQIQRERIRKQGGGRKATEKKRRKS
jgi:hypothetical protein